MAEMLTTIAHGEQAPDAGTCPPVANLVRGRDVLFTVACLVLTVYGHINAMIAAFRSPIGRQQRIRLLRVNPCGGRVEELFDRPNRTQREIGR
jgi:hypothetical protein